MNSAMVNLAHPGDSVRGLGWEAHLTAAGRRYLTHSGGGPGFATILRLYPEENMGVVVMGDDSTIDREILADVLANMEWAYDIRYSPTTNQSIFTLRHTRLIRHL